MVASSYHLDSSQNGGKVSKVSIPREKARGSCIMFYDLALEITRALLLHLLTEEVSFREGNTDFTS